MVSQKIMWIAWPAFLAACILELVVFAFVDPQDLHWSGRSLGLSRQGVYSLAFFLFWAISMACSALTMLLRMPPEEVNHCPFPVGERPDNCPQR